MAAADVFALLAQYNQPTPRYTSYPAAPHWHPANGSLVASALEASKENLSLYVHIPFCEKLCLYCGCNVVINKDHTVAVPYLENVISEMDLLRVAHGRIVTQIHWGGGTPTYLDTAQITELFNAIASRFAVVPDAEISIEIDPRVTTEDQLRTLRSLGFNRLSLGIQDFDPIVQKAIHRIQSFEATRALFDCARDLGFDSVNVDLIYGLPLQTASSFSKTLDQVVELNPDRIATFSYAHVPSLRRQQRALERDLPSEDDKLRLFLLSIERLAAAGYNHIGIDHFAKPGDPLSIARADGSLHRNFQGYTTHADTDLLAFGVSAISKIGNTYTQNVREGTPYHAAIREGSIPVIRGYVLSPDDRIRAAVIESLLCNGRIHKGEIESTFDIVFDSYFQAELARLWALAADGLVQRPCSAQIILTPTGRIFSRVVARIFDMFAPAATSSKTV